MLRFEPAKRAKGTGAVARFTGSFCFYISIPGLTPQALCFHLLRRFDDETRGLLVHVFKV